MIKSLTPDVGLPPAPTGGFSVRDYRVGDLVQAHPATDAWMSGDRYGRVVSLGRRCVTVLMHTSNRRLRFHPDNLLPSPRSPDLAGGKLGASP